MLINLYNGKPTTDFQEHYAVVAQMLDIQKRHKIKSGAAEITAEHLLNHYFKKKIDGIVATVKDKLQEDAKKDGLVYEKKPIDSASLEHD